MNGGGRGMHSADTLDVGSSSPTKYKQFSLRSELFWNFLKWGVSRRVMLRDRVAPAEGIF